MRGMKVSPFFTVMLFFVVISITSSVANGDTSPSQCKEERRVLVNQCKAVIFGQEPSAGCCERVRATHVECVCPQVTPKLTALLGNVQRIIKKIEGCGRTVPHNFKCGSVTTP